MSKVLLKCNVTGLPNESESHINSKGLAKAIGAEQAFVEEADPRVEASNARVSGWATDSPRAFTVELTDMQITLNAHCHFASGGTALVFPFKNLSNQ